MLHGGIPPAILLFLAGTINVTTKRNDYSGTASKILWDVVVAITIYLLLRPTTPSIVPWWGPLTSLLSQWYRLKDMMEWWWLPPFVSSFWKASTSSSLHIHNGPLGKGASKVIRVVVAIFLWRICHGEWPHHGNDIIRLGRFHAGGYLPWMLVLLLSMAVNGVLYLWSRYSSSSHNNNRGRHEGVHAMVESSLNRSSLTFQERLHFATMAFLNACCEEITFRGFWWQEFALLSLQQQQQQEHDGDNHNTNNNFANIAQAAIFGIWHYHGIPSGMSGVALTFVYGWIMGVLKERGVVDGNGSGGLLMPIVAHTLSDYYIFSTIARGKVTAAKTGGAETITTTRTTTSTAKEKGN